jgi:hypothetical protein
MLDKWFARNKPGRPTKMTEVGGRLGMAPAHEVIIMRDLQSLFEITDVHALFAMREPVVAAASRVYEAAYFRAAAAHVGDPAAAVHAAEDAMHQSAAGRRLRAIDTRIHELCGLI